MIDVKELRIGSHVLAGGVRAKVIDIHKRCLNSKDYPYQIFVEGISPDDGEKKVVGGLCDKIEPIPLTAALLAELGFDLYDDGRDGGVLDTGDYFIWVDKREGHYWQCQIRERFGLKDDIVDCCGFYALHQLETIVYNATEIELIKED